MMRTAVWKPSLAPSTKASYTLTRLRTPATIKQMMMTNSSTLAVVVPTRFIMVLSKRLKPQMMPATATDRPPSVANSTGCNRLMR